MNISTCSHNSYKGMFISMFPKGSNIARQSICCILDRKTSFDRFRIPYFTVTHTYSISRTCSETMTRGSGDASYSNTWATLEKLGSAFPTPSFTAICAAATALHPCCDHLPTLPRLEPTARLLIDVSDATVA